MTLQKNEIQPQVSELLDEITAFDTELTEDFNRLFMFREFRPFFINRHHIVAFSVHKDRFKSHLLQGVNQVAAAIPRIEGDRIVSDIRSGLFKEGHHFLEHRDDTGGFIRIPASLFANQSHIQGNDPFSNLYCDPQYILPLHRLICLRRPPIGYVGEILSITENKGIIHTNENTQTR